MKVTQGPVKFEPVTIVLETPREANLMYHLFNKGLAMGLKEYMNQQACPSYKWRDLREKMSEEYREAYQLTEEDC